MSIFNTKRLRQLTAQWRKHVVIGDTLITVFIILLLTPFISNTFYEGLLIALGGNTPLSVSVQQYEWIVGFWTWIYVLPMAFRRSFPQGSALAFVLICLLQLLFGPYLVYTDIYALVHLYTVIITGSRARNRAFILIATGMAILTSTVAAVVTGLGTLTVEPRLRAANLDGSCLTTTGTIIWRSCSRFLIFQFLTVFTTIMISVTATIIIAYWQKSRLHTISLMRERTALLAARQHEEAHIAALAERARIARDMHDVVAHTLSTIIVQADGGRFAGAGNIAIARTTMTTIEQESSRALSDMRRLLSGLQEPNPSDSNRYASPEALNISTPSSDSPHMANDQMPSYGNVAVLVEHAKATAPSWNLQRIITGTPEPNELGADGATTVYRLVQESLTNIRKYAGSQVRVRIHETWSANGLQLTVIDNGLGSSSVDDGHTPGFGLLGMRERVKAQGGTLRTGFLPSGGFEVTATIPFTSDRNTTAITSHRDNQQQTTPTPIPVAARKPTQPRTNQGLHGFVSQTPTSPDETITANEQIPSPSATRVTANWLRQSVTNLLNRMRRSFHMQWQTKDEFKSADPNIIEKVAHWCEHHYMIVDGLLMVALLTLLNGVPVFLSSTAQIVYELSGIISALPFVWRRRFPQASAFAFGLMMIVESLLLPWVTPMAILTVFALYSVTLYGNAHALRWVLPMVGVGSLAFALKMTLLNSNVNYPLQGLVMLLNGRLADDTMSLSATHIVMVMTAYASLTALTCFAAIAAGKWSRSRASNMLVLRAREEALLQEEAKQKVLAANMERARISATMQNDIADTLHGVSAKARQGLRMLDAEPSAERIAAAFKDIATEGRSALKRMRQLLGVLRETGSSDDAAPQKTSPKLAPATSLDEQLRQHDERKRS